MWEAVKQRQDALGEQYKPMINGVHAAQASRIHRARRPVTLLSGLVECGRCGSNVGLAVHGRFGCINHHRRHTCDNNRTIGRDALEKRVLAGLRERLVSPKKVQAAVLAYTDYINRENEEQRALVEADCRALDKIERAIAGTLNGALMGILDFAKEAPRPAAVVTTKVAQGSQA